LKIVAPSNKSAVKLVEETGTIVSTTVRSGSGIVYCSSRDGAEEVTIGCPYYNDGNGLPNLTLLYAVVFIHLTPHPLPLVLDSTRQEIEIFVLVLIL
jgi:hypothetical protein